jgi:hypothetical protein
MTRRGTRTTKPNRAGRRPKRLLREGLQAGGFSASSSMANRDYDGGYLPTQVAPREEFLEMAKVMREFNRGSIEWTMGNATRVRAQISIGTVQDQRTAKSTGMQLFTTPTTRMAGVNSWSGRRRRIAKRWCCPSISVYRSNVNSP